MVELCIQCNLESTVLTKVKHMPRDLTQAHHPIIPDGRESWNKISEWYEGSAVQDAMRTYAHTKIHQCKLHKNSKVNTYITTMINMFELLHWAHDPKSESAQITNLLDNIEDTKYSVVKKIL